MNLYKNTIKTTIHTYNGPSMHLFYDAHVFNLWFKIYFDVLGV